MPFVNWSDPNTWFITRKSSTLIQGAECQIVTFLLAAFGRMVLKEKKPALDLLKNMPYF